MIDNHNYPWYIQKSPGFTALYNGLFNIVKAASPLGLGDMFNIEALPAGPALFQVGKLWGLTDSPSFFDGLIYDVDKWSETKVWSGSVSSLEGSLYRNFLRMKIFIHNNRYSLKTLKQALDILLSGQEAEISVTERTMGFTINVKSDRETIRILQTLQSFDLYFMGQPCGIHYEFNYELAEGVNNV